MIHFKYIAGWKDMDGAEIEYTFWVSATSENRAHMEAMIMIEWFSEKCADALKGFEYQGASILEIDTKEVL